MDKSQSMPVWLTDVFLNGGGGYGSAGVVVLVLVVTTFKTVVQVQGQLKESLPNQRGAGLQ